MRDRLILTPLLIAVGMAATPLCPAFGARSVFHRKVDALFKDFDRENAPGAALVVMRYGTIDYLRGYGYANLELKKPVAPETAFDAASVAKQFTGLAIGMLVEKGDISLERDIREYLPDVPDFGRPITVQHLVHHTSGLRDWPGTLSLSGMSMENVITMDIILEMVKRQRELNFAPGDEHLYSNTGYNLLAAIAAKVTSMSFREWTDTNLFAPLQMNHTHFCEDPAELVINRAESYAPNGRGGYRKVVSQLAAAGSSSLFITPSDMGKWLLNLDNARVGGRPAVRRLLEPGKLNNGDAVSYGFGLSLGEFRDQKAAIHTGGWAGYRSVVLWLPRKRLAIAVLSNAGNMNAEAKARQVADLYLGTTVNVEADANIEQQSASEPDRSRWDEYLGTYRLGPGWMLAVTRDGDQLMAQATREDRFAMIPLSDTRFFVRAYGAALEFLPEGSGKVSRLLYRNIRAPKLTLPGTTPAVLAIYAGDYWSEELRTSYRLEVREGALGTFSRAGKWIQILPTGPDTFDTDAGGLELEFIRGSASDVSELKISGGRFRNIRFHRLAMPNWQGSSARN